MQQRLIHDDIKEAAKQRLFVAKQFETTTQQQLKFANIALERAHFRVRDMEEVYKMAQRSLEDSKKFLEVVEKRCEEEESSSSSSSFYDHDENSVKVKSGNDNKTNIQDEQRDCNSDTNHTTTPILPEKYTEDLLARIQKLISMFAEEEQMNGHRVFYWNIMSARHMQCIAMSVPLTIDELAECCVGMELSFLERYGERLIRNLRCFVEQERLVRYIDIRPKPKKKKKDTCVTEGVEEEKKKVQFDITSCVDNVGEEEDTASELHQAKQMRLMYNMTTEEEERKKVGR